LHIVASQQRYQEIIGTYDNRNAIESNYQHELNKIDEVQRRRLLQKIRPAAIEMGKPLQRSTNKLVIKENGREIVYLDKINVDALKGNIVEEKAYTLTGKIIQYNRETGWGKFRNSTYGKLSFRVASDKKKSLEYAIIDSMKSSNEVMIVFYSVRDIAGNLIHVIFEGFVNNAHLTNPFA